MGRYINFRGLRRRIRPEEVLEAFGRVVQRTAGKESVTRCIAKGCGTKRGREATLNAEVMHCHRCGRTWDALAIWAEIQSIDMRRAAIELCNHFAVRET